MMNKYAVLGVMSGSSLDGVDLAFCEFVVDDYSKWTYKIVKAATVAYDDEWKKTLKNLLFTNANNLAKYDIEYGKKLAEFAGHFLSQHNLNPDFISSHGHTIFHNPEEGYTFQLGNGQALATSSGFTVISDFRTKDIQLGGQGAPLVPIGDELLFNEYDICLNLGGIANISFKKNGKRLAFDVCPANQLLNHLAGKKGINFDDGGTLAKSGEVKTKLFDLLNNEPFNKKIPPKSLSNENVREKYIPLIDNFKTSIENKLATVVEHIAFQISVATVSPQPKKILVTGGGAFNTFLIRRLIKLTSHGIILPTKELIDFKEALIFGLMGVLRTRDEANCLSSVTGATTDSSAGTIYYP